LIKIPKKQLFKNLPFTFFLFCTYLVVFFYYSIKFNQNFFKILISVYACLSIAIYSYYRKSKKKERVFSLKNEEIQENKNLLLAKIERNKLANYALDEQIERYNSLEHLMERLNLTLSQRETAALLVSEAFRLISKNKGICVLYLLDRDKERLSIISTKKENPEQIIKSKEGDIFDSWILKKNRPLIIEDAKKDFRFDLEKIELDDSRIFRSLIACPLVSGKKIIGVIRLDSPKEKFFSSEDLRLLRTISDLGAVAMENAQLYNRTEELAITDGLTGLYLRRYLLERIDTEIMRVNKEKGVLSILMIDIDNFKKYNDKFGHVAGDVVLKSVAKILNENFNTPGNVIGRYGGEEFTVLLPNTSKAKARVLAEKLRTQIDKKSIVLRKKSTQITVSIGLSVFPEDAKMKEELIQKADSALYKAKSKGRNLVCST